MQGSINVQKVIPLQYWSPSIALRVMSPFQPDQRLHGRPFWLMRLSIRVLPFKPANQHPLHCSALLNHNSLLIYKYSIEMPRMESRWPHNTRCDDTRLPSDVTKSSSCGRCIVPGERIWHTHRKAEEWLHAASHPDLRCGQNNWPYLDGHSCKCFLSLQKQTLEP